MDRPDSRLRLVAGRLLQRLTLRPRQSYKGLICWPLSASPSDGERVPRALAAALEDGFASVELAETLDGRCRVMIENRAAQPIVAVCGEALPGARSGLCANASVIAPAMGSVCVEASQPPAPSQRSVELSNAFEPVDGQVGFIAAIADEIVGIECVSTPGLFADVATTLLRGYAVEAIAREQMPRERSVRFDAPEPFLSVLTNAKLTPPEDCAAPQRLTAPGILGRALCTDGALIHLSAFPIAV